jgi:hypothetical protein
MAFFSGLWAQAAVSFLQLPYAVSKWGIEMAVSTLALALKS